MTGARALTARQLARLVNAYTVDAGPPRTITVPHASQLAALRDVTVTATLLPKQLVGLDVASGTRTVREPARGGRYGVEAGDGDLHFCVGASPGQPHLACELQNAKAWIAAFNDAVASTVTVSAFFRCLFEHPGFRRNDDAHIFELHPVRAVNLGGGVDSFDVDIPDQDAIHTWTSPFDLNTQDQRTRVTYQHARDTLTFSGMDGRDENYVRVSGEMSDLRLNTTSKRPAQFTLTAADIGHPISGYALQGTRAARQLRSLAHQTTTTAELVALRNIDLGAALKGRYEISILAIDIQT